MHRNVFRNYKDGVTNEIVHRCYEIYECESLVKFGKEEMKLRDDEVFTKESLQSATHGSSIW